MTHPSMDPRSALRAPWSRATRSASRPFALTTAATALFAGAALGQMSLVDAVPEDAFSFYHWKSSPEAAFIREHSREVLQAIADADFGGMLMNEIAPIALRGDDLETARQAYALVEQTLGAVPWRAFGEDELIFAMRQYGPDAFDFAGGGYDRQILVGSTVDEDKLVDAYTSLTRIFATLQQVLPENIELAVVIDDGEARRELGDHEALGDAMRYLGTGTAVMCDLSATMDLDDGWGYRKHTLGSLMFVEDKVFLGAQRDADQFTSDALDSLRGRAPCLVDTPRFEAAFEPLPAGYERVYFDMHVMLEPMEKTLLMVSKGRDIDHKMMSKDPQLALVAEAFSLADCWGSFASTTHVQGKLQISDSVVFFRDEEETKSNPFYKATMSPRVGDSSLIEFVPATATGFSMHSGFDLVPFYDWALDRAAAYIPDAKERYIPVFKAMQGVVGIDVREELLPLIGSPAVTIKLPKQGVTNSFGASDTVFVTKPSNPDASRDLEKRIVAVATNMLPLLRDEFAPLLRQYGVHFDVSIAPNDGAFRTLQKITFEVGFGMFRQSEALLFGHVGPLEIASTSEDAITYVLETYAGEYANITEEGLLVDLGAMPDEDVSTLSMSDFGGAMREAAMGFQQAGAMMPMFTADIPKSQREAHAVVKGVAGTFQRMGAIYGSFDFLGHTVTSTRISEDGDAVFSRAIIEYID